MFGKSIVSGVWLATLAFLICGCENKPLGTNSSASDTNRQVFEVRGVLKEIKPNGRVAEIAHEEITNYMGAMTMDFEVKDKRELAGLKPGDALLFRMVVTKDDGWIENVRKLPPATPTNALQTLDLPTPNSTNPATFRRAPIVEPLNIGDAIPDYKFTNQFGQPISLAQFKGQALAFTFIFTRCPFPTFCPRMSQHFLKVQNTLKTTPNGPTNWFMLSISFDPEWDTPARLAKYAAPYNIDTNHWQMATSDMWNIDAITEQFGMVFYRDTPGGLPNHTLRTVVIDTRGRVQKVFLGNEWTPDEFDRCGS
jgi:protein SCO1/2